MLQAKDLSNQGMGKNDVAKAMGVQAFIAGKSIQQAKNFQMRELKDGLAESIKTEQLDVYKRQMQIISISISKLQTQELELKMTSRSIFLKDFSELIRQEQEKQVAQDLVCQ